MVSVEVDGLREASSIMRETGLKTEDEANLDDVRERNTSDDWIVLAVDQDQRPLPSAWGEKGAEIRIPLSLPVASQGLTNQSSVSPKLVRAYEVCRTSSQQ